MVIIRLVDQQQCFLWRLSARVITNFSSFSPSILQDIEFHPEIFCVSFTLKFLSPQKTELCTLQTEQDTSDNWVKGTELVRHRGDLKCSKTSQACLMLHKRLKNPMIPLNPASEIIPTQVLKLLHMDLIWGVPARRTSKRLRKAHPRGSPEQQPSLSTIVSAAQDWEMKKNPPGI